MTEQVATPAGKRTRVWTEEQRAKQSQSQRLRAERGGFSTWTPEQREKLRLAQQARRNREGTLNTIDDVRDSNRQRQATYRAKRKQRDTELLSNPTD